MTTNMSAHTEGVDTAKSDEKIRASVAFDSRILIIEIKKKKVRNIREGVFSKNSSHK